MGLVERICPQGSHRFPFVPLITNCDLFKNDPDLTVARDRV
jgi:hypothetical protein